MANSASISMKLQQHPRPYVRTTIIYCVVVLALSLFVSITRENNKDHLWMAICVGISLIPLVVIFPSLWLWLKPRRTNFFILGLLVGAIPLIVLGHYFLDFVADVLFIDYLQYGPSFWRDRGGLLHYVDNIHFAFILTCLFCIPYFLSVAILQETQLRWKKFFIVSFWILWLGALLAVLFYILANSFN